MANYATLKAAIQQVVKTNGNNKITGALLQQSLLAMIESLGVGYQYMGIANPTTNPGTPDQNVFYLAGSGTYPNFNSLVVPSGYLGVLKYNGSWVKELLEMDGSLKQLQLETTELVYDYAVVAGGSNSKDFQVSLPEGDYLFLIDDNGTGNAGNYNLYFTPSGAVVGVGSICRIGVERGVKITSEISKINVGDINSAITNSGNMLLKIRRVDSNRERIENRDNVENNFSNLFPGEFINGSLSSGNYKTYRAQYRAVINRMLRYNRDLSVKAKTGYKFGIYTFGDDETFISDSGWKTNFVVPANTNFKIIITTTNDNIILSPKVARENVTISTLLDDVAGTADNSLSVVGQGTTGINTSVSLPGKKIKFSIPEPWPITNVGVGGNNVLSVGYVKGGVLYDLQALTKNELDAHFEREFVVVFPEFDYDSTYIFIRADSGSTAKVEWEEYHDYDLINSGRNYEGELIQPKSRFALSQIGQLKNFGTIDQTKLNAQGMAVYEDRYILQGSNRIGVGSHLLVVDTKTPAVSMLTIETLASGQGFHMNNVNLGNKYDAADTLPLVYCSEYYNQHTCKVLRIANDFNSFTEVQTISYGGTAIDTTGYDWAVDVEKSFLYLISFSTTGIKLLRFNLPSITEASVVLTDADVLKTINIPNTSGKTILPQGGTIINGSLWTVFGMDTTSYPGFLAISDLEKGEMVSFVDLSGLGEAEAVSPYKEGVLLCVASGLVATGASLRNPSYVYMIFNC